MNRRWATRPTSSGSDVSTIRVPSRICTGSDGVGSAFLGEVTEVKGGGRYAAHAGVVVVGADGAEQAAHERSPPSCTTRVVIAINPLPGGTWETFHTAWIYLAGAGVDPTTMTRVPHDDWLANVSTS